MLGYSHKRSPAGALLEVKAVPMGKQLTLLAMVRSDPLQLVLRPQEFVSDMTTTPSFLNLPALVGLLSSRLVQPLLEKVRTR